MKNLFVLFNLAILTLLIYTTTNPGLEGMEGAMEGAVRANVQSSKGVQEVVCTGVRADSPTMSKAAVIPDLGNIPLYFIRNNGQVHPGARFYARAAKYTLWLTANGFVFDSTNQRGGGACKGANLQACLPQRDISRLIFPGSNPQPELVAVDESPLKVNYFKGNDPSRWHTAVPTFQAVLYKNLYDKIDLKVYGLEKQVEYDWVVKPGGDPGAVRFRFQNVTDSHIDEQGNLVIESQWGRWVHQKPLGFQPLDSTGSSGSSGEGNTGESIPVEVRFREVGNHGNHTYGFAVGEYRRDKELIIDPVVVPYSTYLGGNAWEEGYSVAVDNKGNAYLTGGTWSTNFPLENQYQSDPGSENADVFVTKIDTTAKGSASLVYSTYLGGAESDGAYGIAADNNGNVYVTGFTWSEDFPVKKQYQGLQGYQDVFITKLDTTAGGASGLVYSTYLGGENPDCGEDIAIDSSGKIYVTGWTYGSNFPLKNAFRTTSQEGFTDAFVAKIDPSKSGTSGLLYSTYLGGKSSDGGAGIAADANGIAYISGWTYSSDFTLKNSYKGYQGMSDAFVTKIDTAKSASASLLFSTCLGGSSSDYGERIAIEGSGSSFAYITGITRSANFPTRNQYQSDQSGDDAFVTKLDTSKSGSSCLVYSTYLGGKGDDGGYGIAVDPVYSGIVYVAGATDSTNFPTKEKYYAYQGNDDVFVSQIDTGSSGSSGLLFSTYLGGSQSDGAYDIAADDSGNVYITGWTLSVNFPKVNQFKADPGDGDYDSFLTKMFIETKQEPPTITLSRTTLDFSAVAGGAQTGAQVLLIGNSGSGSLEWTATNSENWIGINPANGSGDAIVEISVNSAGMSAGSYSGTVTVSDPEATNSPQTVTVNLKVYNAGGTLPPFGQFSTPEEGATLSSSVPVTGWVLDDIGVAAVKIYRSEGNSLAYIGDAVFVEGARPDIEAAYPGYPMNYRAGWGYMMLTHFLPNGGNGTYTIHAKATDMEGKEVSLGARTIIVDNANAVKPFGALDTPAQGGVASGNNFINWGWVLTPQPNTIPIDGSTINVWVDGVNIGHPAYNVNRSDIAQLFPGYNNSNGAAGHFALDTTAYSNGIHTIQWTARDNGGNSDGIGSRYFSVQNTSGSRQSAGNSLAGGYTRWTPGVSLPGLESAAGKEDLAWNYSKYPVRVRKGTGEPARFREVFPDDRGVITIESEELERVEFHLDEQNLVGFQVVGNRLRPLPIGSTLDIKEGILYWQPGPGFVGVYHLVFLKNGRFDEGVKRSVFVIIRPMRSHF